MQNSKLQLKIKNFIFALFIITFFIFVNFSFAQEEIAPEETPAEIAEPQQTPVETLEDVIIWVEDTLPEGATTTGEWNWVEDIKFSGRGCHTDGIKKGLHSHSFKVATAVKLTADSVIEQFVYLDPLNPPKGIMLKLITVDGKDIDLYWEAEEEVFVDTVEYMEAWYMGFLPEAGCWKRLVIKLHELETAPLELIGISFISYDGRTYWDRTCIRNN